MKKRPKIIKISGISGAIVALFVVTCAIAGFVVFPGFVAMNIWNYLTTYSVIIPTISLFQGVMLWSIIGIGGYIINDKHKYLQSITSVNELSDEEMAHLMTKIKAQSNMHRVNPMMMKSGELKPFSNLELGDDKSENENENVSSQDKVDVIEKDTYNV
ncbi:MAG: hypothetical protein R3Y28_01005 [Candidatus Gastranaerophilales bacterium]